MQAARRAAGRCTHLLAQGVQVRLGHGHKGVQPVQQLQSSRCGPGLCGSGGRTLSGVDIALRVDGEREQAGGRVRAGALRPGRGARRVAQYRALLPLAAQALAVGGITALPLARPYPTPPHPSHPHRTYAHTWALCLQRQQLPRRPKLGLGAGGRLREVHRLIIAVLRRLSVQRSGGSVVQVPAPAGGFHGWRPQLQHPGLRRTAGGGGRRLWLAQCKRVVEEAGKGCCRRRQHRNANHEVLRQGVSVKLAAATAFAVVPKMLEAGSGS